MSKLYMHFSNCVPVKGFNRSAIYDIQKTRYLLVENKFADLLITNKNKIVLNNKNKIYENLLKHLVKEEWGIFTSKSIAKNFPELDMQWKHYAKITNTQIDFANIKRKNFDFFFQNVLLQIESLNCKTLQINFLELIDYKTLHEFLVRFNDTDIHQIIIYLPYTIITNKESNQLFIEQPRLNLLCYYNCPDQLNHLNEKSYYSPKTINSRNQNNVSTDYFTTNIKLFTESQNHNTYYNRKLSIDPHGNIKNTPEQSENFGNIKDIPIKNVIELKKFQRLWYIHKEMIDVCKDCEFRHMCVDSCNLIKRKDNTWYRSKECNYNPYISKWSNEQGYKTLSQCGITVNKFMFQVKRSKLDKINHGLWGV